MTGNLTNAVLARAAMLSRSEPLVEDPGKRLRESVPLLIGFLAGCVISAAAAVLGDWSWSLPLALAGGTRFALDLCELLGYPGMSDSSGRDAYSEANELAKPINARTPSSRSLASFSNGSRHTEEHIMADAHLTVMDSALPADETRQRLRAALMASGNTIFADIDQSAAAAAAGLALRPTWLIVFGNPRGGTGIMQRDPLAAYELPLKLLVWREGERTCIAYRKPSDIGAMFGLSDLADKLTAMDAGIAKIIATALEPAPTSAAPLSP